MDKAGEAKVEAKDLWVTLDIFKVLLLLAKEEIVADAEGVRLRLAGGGGRCFLGVEGPLGFEFRAGRRTVTLPDFRMWLRAAPAVCLRVCCWDITQFGSLSVTLSYQCLKAA